MGMKYIREYYGIPVKKGMEVYHPESGLSGKIEHCKGGYVDTTINSPLSRRPFKYHPYDLDYLLDDGTWLEGAKLRLKRDEQIDGFNKRLNKQKHTVR